MLSKVFLAFFDQDIKLVYQNEKKDYYSRVLPVVTFTQAALTCTLLLLYFMGTYEGLEMHTNFVNIVALLTFGILSCLVRCSHTASWFVCPSITAVSFYYFAWVDYDGTNVSIYYTMIVGITVSFFILIVFNEVWLISTAVYTPLLAYYMWKTGKDMVGNENQELVIRCVFCIFLYAIVAYKVESLNKQAFLGNQSSELAFYRWLKIFETFPEGLALVRKGQIMYANKSLPAMFEFDDYQSQHDKYNEALKKLLSATEVTRMGKDTDPYQTTAWGFLDHIEKGAPFSLNVTKPPRDGEEGQVEDQVKYISLNKVAVNVAGSQDKLFVVRDLNSMVNLQKLMYTRQHFNYFTEKIVRQIQEASEVSLINLQKLDNHLDASGRPVADETLNETKRVLHRILDFEQVYNICEGSFSQNVTSFKISEILEQVRGVFESEFKKRNIQLNTPMIDQSVPELIRCSHLLFRQVVMNLVLTSVAGSVRTTLELKVHAQPAGQGHNVSVEIINKRNELSRQQCQAIEELCLEEELVRILESENMDLNLIIALILSRQLGWPVDFVSQDSVSRFILVVPSQPFIQGSVGYEERSIQPPSINQPVLKKPPQISPDQMHKEAAEVNVPNQPEPPMKRIDNEYPECLLVSCSDLLPLFEKGLGFKCDESFLEESAINSIGRSIKKKQPYRFIFVDLDDPTLLLGRFMISMNKILKENSDVKIDVYACASTSSERMLKKCKEVDVTFIAKPMTKDKVKHLVDLYKN